MATEISNGKQTVKLYNLVNRGKVMFQLSYYKGGNEVDLDRGYVTVAASKAKTRRRRLVPILDNLKLWLLPHKQASGPICLHNQPQMAARYNAKEIKWVKNGLRHSYISYRLAILHDTARVALGAGNSPEIIFGHKPLRKAG